MTTSPTTVAGALVGTSGVTFPLWGDVVSVALNINQGIIVVGGLVVLVLTIRKLLIENRIATRRLREMDEGGGK